VVHSSHKKDYKYKKPTCEEYENRVRKIESCTTSFKCNNKGLAIAGVVIRRPLIKETRILSQFGAYGICGGNKWQWDRFLK
jgi:hypothetical protein